MVTVEMTFSFQGDKIQAEVLNHVILHGFLYGYIDYQNMRYLVYQSKYEWYESCFKTLEDVKRAIQLART